MANIFTRLFSQQPAPEAKQPKTQRTAGDGLENVVAGLGTTRDKRVYTSYTAPVLFTNNDLENIYRSSFLARKIIEIIPDDMTRKWRTVTFDESQMEQQKAFIALEKKLKLRKLVNDALCWGRLYGGAVIVIGEEGAELDTELNVEAVQKDAAIVLRVFDRYQISSTNTLITDVMNPNFGLPEMYRINVSGTEVHHSRVIRFGGAKTPYETWKMNNYWDDSVITSIYNTLVDTDTTVAGVATMIFESNIDVIKTPGMIELLSTPQGEQRVIKRFNLSAMMKSFNRVLMLDGQEEYSKHSNSFANLDAILDKFMSLCSSASGIPVTKLFGTSAKGLNATGEGDLKNYYDEISSAQESDMRPALEYLDQILLRAATGAFPDDYEMTFGSLYQMDDVQKSTVEKTRADRDRIYYNMGIVPPKVIGQQLKMDGTYTQLTDEDIEALEDLVPPTQSEEPMPGEEEEPPEGEEKEPAEKEKVEE